MPTATEPRAGIEPATSRLRNERCYQLSYRGKIELFSFQRATGVLQQAVSESNAQQSVLEADALTVGAYGLWGLLEVVRGS